MTENHCAHHPSVTHANSSYRRTIRNNSKLDHWRARNSSIQLNAILHPKEFDKPCFECSCECIDICPPTVTKTASGIRWRKKKKKPLPSSKYHKKCSSDKILPTKIQPTNLTRNVITSANCHEDVGKRKKGNSKNQCYCLSPPKKPLLPVKPFITQPNCKRIIESGFKTEEGEKSKGYDLQTLKKAKGLLNYVPKSKFLKKLYKEASKTFDCQCAACKTKCKMANMEFTTRRQLLEDAYDDVDAAIHRCKLKCGDKSCVKICKTFTSVDQSSLSPQYSPRTSRHFTNLTPEDTPRSPQRYDSDFSPKTSPKISHRSPQRQNSGYYQNASVTNCDKIGAVKRIRNEHYFDTHSTSFNLSPQNIPPHKCVHRFALDDRLLPTPLHSDAFGVSRCTKCNKPMASASQKQIDSEEQLLNVIDYTQEKSAEAIQQYEKETSKHFSRKMKNEHAGDMLQNMPQKKFVKNFNRKIREISGVPMMQNMLQKESSENYSRKIDKGSAGDMLQNMPQMESHKNLYRKISDRSAVPMMQNMLQKEYSKNFNRDIIKRRTGDGLQNMPLNESSRNFNKINYESSAAAMLQNMSSKNFNRNFNKTSTVYLLENMPQRESSKNIDKKIYERSAMLQNMSQNESSKNLMRTMNEISAADMPQNESSKNFSKKIYERYSLVAMPQKDSSKNFSRKINIASKNEIVELKEPPPSLLFSQICQMKTIIPDNSWALRYQKGVY